MDLETLLKNAGIISKELPQDEVQKHDLKSNEINKLESNIRDSKYNALEAHDGTRIIYDSENNTYRDLDYDIEISEDDPRVRILRLEDRYIKFKEEAAGVGLLTKHNTTADVKKGTLKKMAKGFGFNITDNGIPPIVSKDSWKK